MDGLGASSCAHASSRGTACGAAAAVRGCGVVACECAVSCAAGCWACAAGSCACECTGSSWTGCRDRGEREWAAVLSWREARPCSITGA
eukprot:scaffold158956_cov30-Tisochrysis_lutea.AAC.6